MKRAVIAAGGWAHPPADSVAAAARLVAERGFDPAVVTDAAELATTITSGCDLLVVSACWFSMTDDRYTAEQRRSFAVPADPIRNDALDALRLRGCPLLALHTAVICFDEWPGWRDWLGGTWNWETSWHPPPGQLSVVSAPTAPTATIDVSPFEVVDEEYQGLDVDPDSQIAATSGAGHPLVWTHQSDFGRAAINLLGHDSRSLDAPEHVDLNRGLLTWLLED